MFDFMKRQFYSCLSVAETSASRNAVKPSNTEVDNRIMQVLRCSNCHARVALERDILEHREFSTDVEVIVLTSFANVVFEDNFAKCVRCGKKHFSSELIANDVKEKELVLKYKGEDVFVKSPMRVLTMTELDIGHFYTYENRLRYPDEKFVPGVKRERIVTWTFDVSNPGVDALRDIVDIGNLEREKGTEVVQTNVAWMPWRNTTSVRERFAEDLEANCPELYEKVDKIYVKYDFDRVQAEVFGEEGGSFTYDFVLLSRCANGGPVLWSGIRAREMEEALVASWVASGGNILLAQWGLPWHTTSDEVEKGVNLTAFEKELDSYSGGDTNEQETLLLLLRQHHYLAWWKREDRLPNYAKLRIRYAMHSPIHKLWKFRRDIHEGPFDLKTEGIYRPTRANEIEDKFMPPGQAKIMDIERANLVRDERNADSSAVYALVRKSSRFLYASGLLLFKTLEERWNSTRQPQTV